MYDFTHLNNTQQSIYDAFKLKLCSASSPLSNTKNEEDFRVSFENELNLLLRNLNLIDNDYEIFTHETKNEYGRTDFQYGNTIIEYKKYNRLSNTKELNKAQKQTQNYLKDIRYTGYKMYAFLFDGVQVYSYIKNEDDKIFFNKNKSGDLTVVLLDYFICTIFQSGTRVMSPNNIRKDFGIIDKNNHLLNNVEVLGLARYLFDILLDNSLQPKTILLYKEWEKMFRLAENDNGKHKDINDRRTIFTKIFNKIIDSNNEYKALFALHTTLSIIIKLFLTRAICDKVKIDDFYKTDDIINLMEFFSDIENGTYFNLLGILNLTDNDFFSWYVNNNFNYNMAQHLQKIILKICFYENVSIMKNKNMLDLFKELYLNFIPKCVRHSFGEYYTPYWLAERTFLSAVGNETDFKDKTFIDPNCGSGTFLIIFFNYKHKVLEKKIDFHDFVSGIVGIDINPIAVLMARANVLLKGLQQCDFDKLKKYEIPVYLADSLYTPKQINIDGIDCLDYNLNTSSLQKDFGVKDLHMRIPTELVLNENFLNIITEIEQYIIKLEEKKAYECFLSYLEPATRNSIKIQDNIKETVKELIKYEQKKVNSIWLKIFSNYFKVATFSKFDYIIGNPAWVQWSVLPENYRNNIKNNMRLDGLFSNDKNVGGNNLNICALIANKSCERWLNNDGIFCFLMPKSILFNKSFEGFRNLIINKKEQLYLNEIVDFSQGGEIFDGVKIPFCAYKISRNKCISDSYVPVINYKKNINKQVQYNHDDTWIKTQQYFIKSTSYAMPLRTNINNNYLIVNNLKKIIKYKKLIGSCEYKFRKGVSVKYQMRLKFVSLANNQNNGLFYSYIKKGNRLYVDTHQKIELELKYIKPFVTAPMLKDKWQNDYCICPYEDNEKTPIPLEILKKQAPLIAKYLLDNEKKLSQGSNYNKRVQNISTFYGILRMGKYIYNNIFVCIRDNTDLSPTKITKIKTHWGNECSPLFDNHISYISEVLDNNDKHVRFIDDDEADYILSILTNKDVQYIIINSQDGRSISSRLPINIKLKS